MRATVLDSNVISPIPGVVRPLPLKYVKTYLNKYPKNPAKGLLTIRTNVLYNSKYLVERLSYAIDGQRQRYG